MPESYPRGTDQRETRAFRGIRLWVTGFYTLAATSPDPAAISRGGFTSEAYLLRYVAKAIPCKGRREKRIHTADDRLRKTNATPESDAAEAKPCREAWPALASNNGPIEWIESATPTATDGLDNTLTTPSRLHRRRPDGPRRVWGTCDAVGSLLSGVQHARDCSRIRNGCVSNAEGGE
ncbi:hypothetical protein LZ30DRAFT_689112 [Colletotrichum cereale]|nr:hypothetical protein LZ30DRAFT_689112 [Colletotrichum cereale]